MSANQNKTPAKNHCFPQVYLHFHLLGWAFTGLVLVYLGRSSCYVSNAKKIRSMKRMIVFIKKRPKSSSNLSITTLFTNSAQSFYHQKFCCFSIRPRKVYHPSIINACKSMVKRHPDSFTKEEGLKFLEIRNWKSEVGDPLETNVVYLPIGGL